MRSLSKVIKGNRVLYDKNPLKLMNTVREKPKTKTVEQSSSLDVGRLLSQNALESAEISIRSAIKEVAAIKQRGKFESNFAHLGGINEGVAKGSIDGELKGREDGEISAEQSYKECVTSFLETVKLADSEVIARAEKIRTDCVNFAFSLAETILGMDIDSDDPKYRPLLNDFLKCSPEYITVEADGKSYQIETLRAEALISAAGDLQGILAYKSSLHETACEEKISENIEPQEETEVTDFTLSESVVSESAKEEEPQPQIAQSAIEEVAGKTADIPITDVEAESEPEEEKILVKSFEYIDFSDDEQPQQVSEESEEEPEETTEKFVFIKPANRKAVLADEKDSMTVADIAELDKDALKNILKNLEPGGIAAALQNQTDAVVDAITSVLSRKNKEKVIEALRYLGPVPKEEADKAAAQLIAMASKASL